MQQLIYMLIVLLKRPTAVGLRLMLMMHNVCKSYLSMSQLEIDGEASLIKGVYNRIIRDYSLSLSHSK